MHDDLAIAMELAADPRFCPCLPTPLESVIYPANTEALRRAETGGEFGRAQMNGLRSGIWMPTALGSSG
jgi:hypothetical protein